MTFKIEARCNENASPTAVGRPEGNDASSSQSGDVDFIARLEKLKSAFDAGLITQQDFDAARAKALGL